MNETKSVQWFTDDNTPKPNTFFLLSLTFSLLEISHQYFSPHSSKYSVRDCRLEILGCIESSCYTHVFLAAKRHISILGGDPASRKDQ
jgi:hypothetical protein